MSSFGGIWYVSQGGTGLSSIANNKVLIGTGTETISASLDAPSSAFVGINDTQTLTNKTLTSPSINGGTIANATLTNPTISGLILGTPLGVASGGTGAATLASGNVLVGNGTSAITATLAAPTSAFVGLTDTQTLTNKTLTSPTISTPSITGGTIANATLTNPTMSGLILGTPLDVGSGGTGVATLTSGNVLVGNGTSAVTTTLAAPSSAFVGLTDNQNMTNKSIAFNGTNTNTALNLYATSTSSSFSYSAGPFTTLPATVPYYFSVLGKSVIMHVPTFTAASGAVAGITSMTSTVGTALPAWLRPTTTVSGKIIGTSNSVSQFAAYTLDATGVLTIALESGSWATTGNNGFQGFAIPYMTA